MNRQVEDDKTKKKKSYELDFQNSAFISCSHEQMTSRAKFIQENRNPENRVLNMSLLLVNVEIWSTLLDSIQQKDQEDTKQKKMDNIQAEWAML